MTMFGGLTRSEIMRRIRSRDTGPERRLRALMRKLGLRYRGQRKAGRYTPDAVVHDTRENLACDPDDYAPIKPVAVFVHGCFWHGHASHYRAPKTNVEFWADKVRRNRRRDRRAATSARHAGHLTVTLWECETDAAWARKLEAALRRAHG